MPCIPAFSAASMFGGKSSTNRQLAAVRSNLSNSAIYQALFRVRIGDHCFYDPTEAYYDT